MDPATLGILALILLAMNAKKSGGSGTLGSSYNLTAGSYRLKFKSAKPQTNDLGVIWSTPHMLMAGTGAQTRFESLTVDQDPNFWWYTGLMTYSGNPQQITLFPDMTLEKLS